MKSHLISCPQCTFEQSTFRQDFKELKELFEKLMEGVQDLVAQSNKKNKILEDAHDVKVDVKVNVVECATDQFSIMPKDLQLGEVEKVDNAMFPMDQYENVLIRHIDFMIPEEFDVVDSKFLLFFVPTKVILDLKTGFEEDKNFHVVLNSVIAGRYHVTEYLGSAAFSKAIQAHDLHTGLDVCVKIIKNNKDFFDQSLDEIKLLKYVNKHDPGDKYHILRLYDYFYYREHLLIVCELLKANLYEFHKFNRESGGEVYFTMPRLQSITIQCLEALQFLHGLGLIHCDLKPENILVKSYSRCEVKVIDLGSSCFETDHLCSYVQSRSYRAPEVILGLSYDKKIDVWSLGCILAELCTGNVLFQNDSPATLLARVMGIIAPIDQSMLAKGRDTYKYFTKNHMLYERNQK
uniref:Protein kinase domain-containing protein n=1 Tax=Quercus lobata TaxID=97700 RepID=A0A7N2MRJ5_QUELO